MKLSIITVLVLLAVVNASNQPFTTCGTGPLTISSVDLTPYPVPKGSTLVVTATGSVSEQVTSGKYTLSVELFGIKVLSKTGDFCKLSANFTCPHPAGPAVFQLSEAIPTVSPTGTLTIKLSATDQNDKLLFCVGLKVDVVSADEFAIVQPEPFRVSEKCSDSMPVLCNILPRCEEGTVAARYRGCYRCVRPELDCQPMYEEVLPLPALTAPGAGHDVDFTNCGSNPHVTVQSISMSPYPLQKGQTLTVTAKGDLTETLTSGSYTLSVSLFGITVLKKTGDVCTLSPSFKCPHTSGEVSLDISQAIPSAAPSGTFDIKLQTTDQNKANLFCVSLKVSIQ